MSVFADCQFKLSLRLTRMPLKHWPQELGVPRQIRRADAAEGSCQNKCQTADDSVSHQRDHGRGRKDDHRGRSHRSNRCGHENHSCEHVRPPLRMLPVQTAGPAWQDCGRAWVNLRQVVWRARRGETDTGGVLKAAAFGKPVLGGAQPSVVAQVSFRRKIGSPLIGNGFLQSLARVRSGVIGLSEVLSVTMQIAAAIWRKPGAGVWPGITDVIEDCLSFVIPEQHGTSVAGCEDGT